MRIAYITTIKGSAWGGSEELWYLSAEEAVRRNYEVGVFVYNWQEDPAPIKSLREKGVSIFKRPRSISLTKRMALRALSWLGITSPLALNPYKPLLRFKPGAIVITDGIYYTADDPWLKQVLKKFKKQYIIISQGNGSYHQPQNRQETIALFEDARYIMFVAEQNQRLTFHQLAHRLKNAYIIQNPVRLLSYEQLPLPVANDNIIHCAAVGRFFVADKGQDILVAMMAESYWRNSNIVVHLFGNGSDRDYLADLIRFYNVPDKVIIEDHANIIDIWKKCHCLLMPSILEGTPLTLLEALVVGRVCVVTRVGGNDEWVTDGVNGYLVEAPTQLLFSEKMKQVIAERQKWPAITLEAHKSALAKLDKNPGVTLLDMVVNNR